MINKIKSVIKMISDESQLLLDKIAGKTISDAYLEMNKQLHDRQGYGTSSSKWAETVLFLFNNLEISSVLDYGCGKALLSKNLKPTVPVVNYDPAIEEFSQKPTPADLVACTDVLEHIEPHLLNSVLKDLSQLSKKAALLVISCRPAKKFLPDGRNAHLIQKDTDWWIDKLKAYFPSVELLENDRVAQEIVLLCGPNASAMLGQNPQKVLQGLKSIIHKNQQNKPSQEVH